MGYDIHITRSADWADIPNGQEITADEWIDYISKDPDLRLAGYNGDYFALWSGPSTLEEPWFDWSSGRIDTKNPDQALVEKAIAIAQALGARVQGDDGEFYPPSNEEL